METYQLSKSTIWNTH